MEPADILLLKMVGISNNHNIQQQIELRCLYAPVDLHDAMYAKVWPCCRLACIVLFGVKCVHVEQKIGPNWRMSVETYKRCCSYNKREGSIYSGGDGACLVIHY